MSCNVCIESFNKSNRQEVSCDFCDFKVCRVCCETYLLQSVELAHCMNCKREWSRKMLVDKFTKKFINNDYKKHQEEVFFEKEQSFLPATQPLVERMKRELKIKEHIEMLKKEMGDIVESLRYYHSLLRNPENHDDPKTFIRKCCNEECRGFLDSQWKCGLCEMSSCSNCYEVKDTDHTCLQVNIETAKLLAKDTKPCPKCGTLIYKSEGCHQMWCTQCHTTFDWKSGRLETGTIHNPHYIEWLRRNGQLERNPNDIQCGREIDNRFITTLAGLHKQFNIKNDKHIFSILRNIIHLRYVDILKFTANNGQNNEDLRVMYLMNSISKEHFKAVLHQRHKKGLKNHELSNIIGMFITSVTDIMYRYVNKLLQTKRFCDFSPYNKEIENLREYVNSCLKDVSCVFNCTRYYIHYDVNDKRANYVLTSFKKIQATTKS